MDYLFIVFAFVHAEEAVDEMMIRTSFEVRILDGTVMLLNMFKQNE